MSTLTKTKAAPEPVAVQVSDDVLSVELSDGRSISAPLAWFPRLLHGTAKERSNFKLGHFGIHWPDLDEDIAIEGLLAGEKSGESMASLKQWLVGRARTRKAAVPTFELPRELADLHRRRPGRRR